MMGWFWADSDVSVVNARRAPASPPPSCPMHQKGADTMKPKPATPSAETACPYTPADIAKPVPETSPTPKYSKYNPLNYMFSEISQEPSSEQKVTLPTEREPSTIPKGSGDGNWEYPSPQQMYNALLRKGYTDTDASAVESMVSVHNYLNEGAWAEIVEWERRFGRGLGKGWEICKKGEESSMANATFGTDETGVVQPKLIRFMGRPQEMTPKAVMIQVLGRLYPSRFAVEPPFDRHDWFVQREHAGQVKEVRYVIDYYSIPDEGGLPVFSLDVRPALTPTAAVERMMRWGGDVWYRASGAVVRERASN